MVSASWWRRKSRRSSAWHPRAPRCTSEMKRARKCRRPPSVTMCTSCSMFCRISVNLKMSLLRLNDSPSQDCHSKHLWHAPMTVPAVAAASFCGAAFVFHIVSIIIMARRCRPRPAVRSEPATVPAVVPPVSIVRPVCGLDNFLEETLCTSFELDYPRYELIFCVASTRDPAIAVVQQLIGAHPQADARLLVGDDRVSQNPKLNNCVKGWRAAKYDW